ncbi:hypothetical protein AB0L14_28450 [Streptomyces sp. NPDC052727]|uniref:hypothetical protein n=1 Tax=Streptomyces sp. NPDC052727 TaxID=3154854 RepID=UPI00344A2D71
MLAAAALAGVVLLTVPLLLAGGDKDKPVAKGNVSQDTVLTGGGATQNAGVYVPDQADDGKNRNAYERATPSPTNHTDPEQNDAPDTSAREVTRGGGERGATASSGGSPTHGSSDATPSSEKKTAKKADQQTAKTQEAAPAPSWEKTARRFTNGHSGICLSRIEPGRFVGQSACGSDTWTRMVLGTGYVLIKHAESNMCLDTDENELYVSPCTDKDPGQRWRTPSAGGCTVYLESIGNRYLTGWNTNTASMRLKDDADDPAKQKWRVSPALSSGC